MKAVLLFVDGLGLGERDPEKNPLAGFPLTRIGCYRNGPVVPVPGDGVLVPLDANLDTEGLPQSATGQTALFTGINTAALIGRHLPGYPNEILRNVLRERSILKQVRSLGFRAAFINAYRPLFFHLKPSTQWRLSTTTVANLSAGLPFFRIEDIVAGRAVYHDFTNRALIDRGFGVPLFSPGEAARILAGALGEYDFILYEYFLTDHAGHSMDMQRAGKVLMELDGFIAALLEAVDLSETLVILTSDHGNIEDLSVKTHSRNPVPAMLWGPAAAETAARMRGITDVTPVLIDLFSRNGGRP